MEVPIEDIQKIHQQVDNQIIRCQDEKTTDYNFRYFYQLATIKTMILEALLEQEKYTKTNLIMSNNIFSFSYIHTQTA